MLLLYFLLLSHCIIMLFIIIDILYDDARPASMLLLLRYSTGTGAALVQYGYCRRLRTRLAVPRIRTRTELAR